MDKHRKRETDTEKQVLSACKVKRYIERLSRQIYKNEKQSEMTDYDIRHILCITIPEPYLFSYPRLMFFVLPKMKLCLKS